MVGKFIVSSNNTIKEASATLIQGTIGFVSQDFCHLFGYHHCNQVMDLSPSDLSPLYQPCGALSLTKLNSFIAKTKMTGRCESKWTFKTVDGELFQANIVLIECFEQDSIHFNIAQLSSSSMLVDALANFMFTQSSDAMFIAGANAKLLAVNQAFQHFSGFSSLEVFGRSIGFVLSKKHGNEFHENVWHELQVSGIWQGDIWGRHKSGNVLPRQLKIQAIKNSVGEVTHYLGSYTDSSQSGKSIESLNKLAYFDSLTELPNRRYLLKLLNEWINTNTIKHSFALMIIDIDEFKSVNDKFGHKTGDSLLRYISRTLAALFTEDAVVGRLGGDEIMVLCSIGKISLFVEELSSQLSALFAQPIIFEGEKHEMSVSVGVSIYPKHATEPGQLMHCADLALYKAKLRNNTAVVLFDSQFSHEKKAMVALIQSIICGVKNKEFVAFFQPQFEAKSMEITGYEALARWFHPKQGVIAPAEFIDKASESGLLNRITEQIIEQSCALIASDKMEKNQRVSINLSGRQIADDEMMQILDKYVHLHQVSYQQIEIEITESTLIEHFDVALLNLSHLKVLGVTIALDDFGKGYSSLAYLKSLPVDKLKIDRYFVNELNGDSKKSLNFLEAIIQMGHLLGMEVVAEGIENERQLNILKQLNCNYVQGFLLNKPVNFDRVGTVHIANTA